MAGDAFPDGRLNFTGTDASIENLHLDLAGTATDDKGVQSVRVALEDQDTGRYVQPNGTMAAAFATLNATLAMPGGTSTAWTLGVDLPTKGEFAVTAFAVDTAGQQDTSTSGATARYLVYPGDADPTISDTLFSPTEGTAFTEARIFVSGRAEDGTAMGSVQVAIVNSFGQYMSSSGSFSSTSWCTQNVCAFDGRGSTDENAPTLTHSWRFGNGRSGSGPVPSRRATSPRRR